MAITRLVDDPLARNLDRVEAIYLESFAPSERISFDEFTHGLSTGQRKLITADDHRSAVGFATILQLRDANTWLLEYMAVASAARGHGIGTALLEHVVRAAKEAAGVKWLLLEVEHPASCDPNDMQHRRVRFYERNGARGLTCVPRYRSPDLTGGPPLNMHLMHVPLAPGTSEPRGHELVECIRALYFGAYHLSDDDPLVHATLGELTC